MSKIAPPPKRDEAALTLQERAVLHYALMNRTKDGLFCEKPIATAVALNSSAGSIVRFFKALVRKGACELVEDNRHTDDGFPLPSIYRPITPQAWQPISQVKCEPLHNEGLKTLHTDQLHTSSITPVVSIPNGTGLDNKDLHEGPHFTSEMSPSRSTSEMGSGRHPDPRIVLKGGKRFLKRSVE